MAETVELQSLEKALLAEVAGAGDLDAIERVRIAALGKKGRIPELMAKLGSLPADQRKAFGQAVNGLKTRVGEALEGRKAELERGALTAEALWSASQLAVDDFYDQLKDEEARGLLRENRGDASDAQRLLEFVA